MRLMILWNEEFIKFEGEGDMKLYNKAILLRFQRPTCDEYDVSRR